MQKLLNKRASPVDLSRFRRRREIHEDPLQHLWAVSYSDLLMVLMAFFLLFFQFEDMLKSEDGKLHRILSALEQGGIENQSAKPREHYDPREVASLLSQPSLKVSVRGAQQDLVLDFPSGFFSAGQHHLGSSQRTLLKNVLRVLQPFHTQVSLTFEGHTDPQPVRGTKNKVIDSNLVLSSLRAARAAELAVEQGFEPAFVSALGVAEHLRKSRSLSLLVSGRAKR